MPAWNYTYAASATDYTYAIPAAATYGTFYPQPPLTAGYGDGGGAGVYTAPAPRAQTPFEWLDSEVERTCALARGSQ